MLAVERNPELVAQWAGRIALVEADATNPDALEQLGAREFPVAVVGVGSYLEASVLITGNLVDIGVQQIWAKAISNEHARILQRIGAHHVVLPEADAGTRVAHLVSGKLLDYIEVEDGFTIVKMRPPEGDPGVHARAVEGPRALRRDGRRREEPRAGLRLRDAGDPAVVERPDHRRRATPTCWSASRPGRSHGESRCAVSTTRPIAR